MQRLLQRIRAIERMLQDLFNLESSFFSRAGLKCYAEPENVFVGIEAAMCALKNALQEWYPCWFQFKLSKTLHKGGFVGGVGVCRDFTVRIGMEWNYSGAPCGHQCIQTHPGK